MKNITSGFNKKVNLAPLNAAPTADKQTPVGYKLDVKTIQFSETFQCQANDLYDALTKPDLVSAFTRSEAKVDPSRGGEFVLFGGNITGKFEELIPNKKIVQKWRLRQWPSGHFSNVTLQITQKVSFLFLLIDEVYKLMLMFFLKPFRRIILYLNLHKLVSHPMNMIQQYTIGKDIISIVLSRHLVLAVS